MNPHFFTAPFDRSANRKIRYEHGYSVSIRKL